MWSWQVHGRVLVDGDWAVGPKMLQTVEEEDEEGLDWDQAQVCAV
jgi:hypothetical protein